MIHIGGVCEYCVKMYAAPVLQVRHPSGLLMLQKVLRMFR